MNRNLMILVATALTSAIANARENSKAADEKALMQARMVPAIMPGTSGKYIGWISEPGSNA